MSAPRFVLHPDVADDVRGYAAARGLDVQAAVDRLLSIGLTRAAAVERYSRSAKGKACERRGQAKRRARERATR